MSNESKITKLIEVEVASRGWGQREKEALVKGTKFQF
jgi:hypothetical protein